MRCGFAYRCSSLKDVENCPKCRTGLHLVALVLVYAIENANRKSGEGVGAAATITYGYDTLGSRVFQATGGATTTYPSKYYSITSTLSGATTTATSTEYIWHILGGQSGDTLLATVDGQLANGEATGTPSTRYIHPDHLGSTNAVTDENGGLVQTIDYYPYGSTRTASSTYPTSEARQYIGEVYDEGTGLNYLNARYIQSSRGQFLSQDPTFLAIGNPSQLQNLTKLDQQRFLTDPQQMNSYSYARGNPITNKDPQGNFAPAIAYAAITAPEWGPAVLWGIGAAATYITADIALRTNGWGTRWGGTVPTRKWGQSPLSLNKHGIVFLWLVSQGSISVTLYTTSLIARTGG